MKLCTTKEYCELSCISSRTLRRRVKEGKIKPVKRYLPTLRWWFEETGEEVRSGAADKG